MPRLVTIGVTNKGEPIIFERFKCMHSQDVYKTQLPYRVIAQIPSGKCKGSYRICTRTQAEENGWVIVNENPWPKEEKP